MRVAVADAELFYVMRGAGPSCLILSGIGTEPYVRQTPAPLTDCLRLVCVDLRGSGLSTGEPSDLTFDVLAADLDAVRIDLGLDRIDVLGHSILGILAIEYGRRRPTSVSHVIVVGTPPSGDMARLSARAAAFFEADASEERKAALRENLAALPPEPSTMQTLLAQTPMRFYDPRFDPAPLFAGAVARPQLLRHVVGTLTPKWDVTVGSTELTVPILVAHGRYDYVVPFSLWEGIPPRLPNATFQVFERSGHQPFFEEPGRFAGALTDWMAAQARS
jgi:proline iminopeptidase